VEIAALRLCTLDPWGTTRFKPSPWATFNVALMNAHNASKSIDKNVNKIQINDKTGFAIQPKLHFFTPKPHPISANLVKKNLAQKLLTSIL
jgi:hypothetical protein